MDSNNINTVRQYLAIESKKLDRSIPISTQEDKLKNYIKKLIAIEILPSEIDINDVEIQKLIKENCFHQDDNIPIFKRNKKKNWFKLIKNTKHLYYYSRFEKYLYQEKAWKPSTITNNDFITDQILGEMGDPNSEESFQVKGLVIGDIQSGKTTNYTAVINKSFDAGYKLVIVLAGLTKDLRAQTQERLDKEVLGYQTNPNLKKTNEFGVMSYSSGVNNQILHTLTSSVGDGDLKKTITTHTTMPIDKNSTPYLVVVKKNVAVLNNLKDFIINTNGTKTNGKLDAPVLIIDDEVDQASVNTAKSSDIESASSINKNIRQLLELLNKYSYVGYTATPFANAFIDPMIDEIEGKDIFPEDFIVSIPTPSNYCGVKDFFGVDQVSNEDDCVNLDLVVNVNDVDSLFDDKKITSLTESIALPNSLKNAIKHFFIASAIKRTRDIKGHNSMLVHIHRFKNPSSTLRPLIRDYISDLYLRYKNEESAKNELFDYWEKNIKPITIKRTSSSIIDCWNDIEKELQEVINQSLENIKVVNGDFDDVCNYNDESITQHIILGGDKLSRGLTLDGLVVSYYNRNSTQADSLLQMGRWFGYRDGWIDLCRIFANYKVIGQFINAGLALDEFKNDIANMNYQALTPQDFALKVRYNSVLAPTAKSKMRSAEKQKVSFSGTVQQTISFDRSSKAHNRIMAENFIGKIGTFEHSGSKFVKRNVSSEYIIELISNYKECETLPGSVSVKNWVNYIKKLNSVEELTDWTVVINSLSKNENMNKNKSSTTLAGYGIISGTRTDRRDESEDFEKCENIKIKTLIDPTDFREFFDRNSKEYKHIDSYSQGKEFSSSKIINDNFTAKNAVISIYLIDVYSKKFTGYVEHKPRYKRDVLIEEGIVGIAIWFPNTKVYKDSAVEYYVNKINEKEYDESEGLI